MTDLFEFGFRAHRTGNFAEAARIYREILHRDPKHFPSLYSLGFVHLQSGEYWDAERFFGRAIDVEPRSPEALYARGCALQNLGKYSDAIECFDRTIALKPDHVEALVNRAVGLLAQNRAEEALMGLRQALHVQPEKREALVNAGNALQRLERYDEALGFYDRALLFHPGDADALYNKGRALLTLKRHGDTLDTYAALLKTNPDHPQALVNQAVAYLRMKRAADALKPVERAVQLKPDFVEAHSTRGDVLATLNRDAEAMASYNEALKREPRFADAEIGRGLLLLKQYRFEDAHAAFARAVLTNPRSAAAYNGAGNALVSLGRFDDALAAYDKALQADPGYAHAYNGRGSVFLELKRIDEALGAFEAALRLEPDLGLSWYNRGIALIAVERYEEAAIAFDRALALDPLIAYAEGHRLHARMHMCSWAGIEAELQTLNVHIDEGRLAAPPFVVLTTYADSAQALRAASAFIADKYPPHPQALWRGEDYRHGKIRLGYISGEFREQATAHLTAGLFEHHDRSAFDLYAIATGVNDQSPMRKRLESAFDIFADLYGKSDREIAEFIRRAEIDILIDLNGHFGATRTGVLARRPAPVQVNYLGFPGTMGASYMDYLVADRWVLPETQSQFYSEKIATLPETYQPNDNRRTLSERVFTRAECGLPENGFVFCCFNSAHKVLPLMFDIWMRLLALNPGSVLWLLEANPYVKRNLMREAARRDIDPVRLVFAPFTKADEHLARAGLADLFLDTLPYNAHTTASDALWAGVPVLTCTGPTFQGRVAGSLLRAMGLPDLIAPSPEAYEGLAMRLASDAPLLASIRARLKDNRDSAVLFDTARYTRHLEAAYRTMWEKSRDGLAPESFAVPALPRS